MLDRKRGHLRKDGCAKGLQPRVHAEGTHGAIVPSSARCGRGR
jgi:hypothetical protein